MSLELLSLILLDMDPDRRKPIFLIFILLRKRDSSSTDSGIDELLIRSLLRLGRLTDFRSPSELRESSETKKEKSTGYFVTTGTPCLSTNVL